MTRHNNSTQVREQFNEFTEWQHNNDDQQIDPFRALFTPRSRGELMHIMLGVTEPLTAAEICERYDYNRRTFGDHIDPLLAAGVVREAGSRGNATRYEPNTAHPVVQLLAMAETVQRHGQTPQMLEEQFIGEPGGEIDPETGEEVED